MPRTLLTGLLRGIDHVGICVEKMDEAASLWTELCGLAVAHRKCVLPQKTEALFVDPPQGPASIELVSPMAGNTGLAKFLQKRGDGLHHLALAVTDLAVALERLSLAGVPLIDREPRTGARGHRVAFLHPRAMNGTLVELVERA